MWPVRLLFPEPPGVVESSVLAVGDHSHCLLPLPLPPSFPLFLRERTTEWGVEDLLSDTVKCQQLQCNSTMLICPPDPRAVLPVEDQWKGGGEASAHAHEGCRGDTQE